VIACVAANPSVDRLFEVEQLHVGAIHRPVGFVRVPGGKGLNVARAAKALGQRAAVAGILGGHAGRWIAQALAEEGVEGRFVWSQGESRSSLSVADRASGALTEFYEDGAHAGPADWRELQQLVAEVLPKASWLAVCGSMPPGAPAESYADLVAMARAAGVPTALDSRGDALRTALAAGPDLVKVNAEEAEELLGSPVHRLDQALAGAHAIRAHAGGDGHAAAITLGEAGTVVVDPEGRPWEGRPPQLGVYPVGSGDVFLAGLLVALIRGATWLEAQHTALGAASANAQVPGAACLDRRLAERLAVSAGVRPLTAPPAA
jgi:1-phosphofructokinase family hexose kinase